MRQQPELTTLCYIDNGSSYLMLHRISKKNDINKDKWIGVGGHLEKNESPEECLLREVKEETGLSILSYKARGIITFISGQEICEYMVLFTSDEFQGNLISCDEGVLEWVNKNDLFKLNLWEGDKIFLKALLEDEPFFFLKLLF